MKIIYKDGTVAECPKEEELHVLRHTAAHIMAQAIKRLYPQADFAFGPATENGFFYDVDLGDTKLSDEDLANIEKEMKKICKENLAIKPFILPRDEAVKLMTERQEHYKLEHMDDLADETEFSFYQQGEYVDMCIGPHLTYIDKDGSEKTPVVLHRAILGSLDRFMAYLIEETKGRFPTWLAPTQVKVLPVSEKTLDYARTVADKLTAAGVRVVLDESNEKIGYKIREAQQVDRVPYMLVLGAKEAEAGNISVRDRKGETTTQELDAFINNIVTEIKERRYN